MSVYQGPGCKSEDNHLGRLVIKWTFWAECQRFNKLNFVRQKKGLGLTVAQRCKTSIRRISYHITGHQRKILQWISNLQSERSRQELGSIVWKSTGCFCVNETQIKFMLTLTGKLSSGRRDPSRGSLYLSMMLHVYHESKNHVLHCGGYAFNPSMGEEDIDKSVSSGLRSRPCLKKKKF